MSSEIQLHKQEVVTKDGEQQVLSIPGEKNISNIEVSDLVVEEDIATGDDKEPAIIPRVTMAITTEDYIKYYVPKVVSIGPYHYGDPNLMPIQNLKLDFAKDLFSTFENTKQLVELHAKLGEPDMLQKLRGYYDEISEKKFTDKEFTNMMLLDACFIIYYILISAGRWGTVFRTRKKLSNHQMTSICQDLFLLENQIPFQVLELVGTHHLLSFRLERMIKAFILEGYMFSLGDRFRWERDHVDVNLKSGYLLQHLHLILTSNYKQQYSYSIGRFWGETQQHPLPTAKKLMDAGIHFQPSNKLFQIHFYRHWYWPMSATVKLYQLVVNGSTKLLFLNLLAYEASPFYKLNDKPWPVITSYICLLNSLIGQPEDVKALQVARVLDSRGSGISSEDDVKTFIKEIAGDLFIEDPSYKETLLEMHLHYSRFNRFNKPIHQFKEIYFNNPWALLGSIMALLLTAIQTYFTVWSPKG